MVVLRKRWAVPFFKNKEEEEKIIHVFMPSPIHIVYFSDRVPVLGKKGQGFLPRFTTTQKLLISGLMYDILHYLHLTHSKVLNEDSAVILELFCRLVYTYIVPDDDVIGRDGKKDECRARFTLIIGFASYIHNKVLRKVTI